MSNINTRDFTSYVDLLPVQFKDSDNLIKLLSIYLDQVQELNQAQLDLGDLSTDIDTVFGYQMDILGNLLGLKRQGRGDEDFRDFIKAYIATVSGSGTPEDVINYLKITTKAEKVRYWEHYPASIILETNGTFIQKNLANSVDSLSPAGVKVGGVIVVEDGYAFRPCSISNATTNYKENTPIIVLDDSEMGELSVECGAELVECTQISPARAYYMGEDDSYMGNRKMNLANQDELSERTYQEVPKDSLLGQSILPNISEAYVKLNSLSGQDFMVSGKKRAQAAGLVLSPTNGLGILANVSTLKSNNISQ